MTTHEVPFDQVGQALNLMTRETDGVIKPLLRFS